MPKLRGFYNSSPNSFSSLFAFEPFFVTFNWDSSLANESTLFFGLFFFGPFRFRRFPPPIAVDFFPFLLPLRFCYDVMRNSVKLFLCTFFLWIRNLMIFSYGFRMVSAFLLVIEPWHLEASDPVSRGGDQYLLLGVGVSCQKRPIELLIKWGIIGLNHRV